MGLNINKTTEENTMNNTSLAELNEAIDALLDKAAKLRKDAHNPAEKHDAGIIEVKAYETVASIRLEIYQWGKIDQHNTSFEGYVPLSFNDKVAKEDIKGCPMDGETASKFLRRGLGFGHALEVLKQGGKVARRGWNGKNIFIALSDEAVGFKRVGHDGENCDIRINSFLYIDNSFLYIDTTGLQTGNEPAPKCVVPWSPSQTDMLAEDWYVLDAKGETE